MEIIISQVTSRYICKLIPKAMILQFEPHRTISEIKDEFHAMFPFLKLEFFKKSHGETEPSHKKEMIQTDVQISDISHKSKSGAFNLTPATTVAGLETALR